MKKLLLLLLCLPILKAGAQSPQLAVDLVPGATGSGPYHINQYNGKLYFGAFTPATGGELWSYDGSTAPVMVPEMNVGTLSSFSFIPGTAPALFKNKLYFAGDNGSSGYELFSYDGVNAPMMVAELNSGSNGSLPTDMTVFDNHLFFGARGTSTGIELYRYDGSGAPELLEIYPGANGSDPHDFCAYKGKLYFAATMPLTGEEVYVYDPATNTVSLAAELQPGAGDSFPLGFVVMDGYLYFAAKTTVYGRELYRFDGSSAVQLHDLAFTSDNGVAPSGRLIPFNGRLYYPGSTNGITYQLFRYDPATDTSTLVHNVLPGGTGTEPLALVYQGKLYFSGRDATHGTELWVHDGSSTSRVADINPGSADAYPSSLCEYNGSLYFAAADPAFGRELFVLRDATGISAPALVSRLSAAPNPTSGDAMITVRLAEKSAGRLQLSDASGRLVWESAALDLVPGEHRLRVPLAQQPAGTYFYSLKQGEKTIAAGRLVRQ